MPVSKHYGGHGTEVMANMQKEYGSKEGKRVFYATENKQKSNRSVMGRKVIHHSPDKHPVSTDAMTPDMLDKMIEQAAQQSTGTYSNARKVMRPAQQPMPRDTSTDTSTGGGVIDYMRRLMPGGK